MGTGLILADEESRERALSDVVEQVRLIQHVMKSVMREGEHFGSIPGLGTGDKKTLLKSGAEKLCSTFRLCPKIEMDVIEHPKGHREYRVKVTLLHGGEFVAEGVGVCSTLETRYRYRSENTHKAVPKEYWDSRDASILGGSSYYPRKVDGQWMIMHRVEHPDPADYYNTAAKMAKKRALVDATLTACAASDLFTQDVEDLPPPPDEQVKDAEVEPRKPEPPPRKPPAKAAPSVPDAKGEGDAPTPPDDSGAPWVKMPDGVKAEELIEAIVTHVSSKPGSKRDSEGRTRTWTLYGAKLKDSVTGVDLGWANTFDDALWQVVSYAKKFKGGRLMVALEEREYGGKKSYNLLYAEVA